MADGTSGSTMVPTKAILCRYTTLDEVRQKLYKNKILIRLY